MEEEAAQALRPNPFRIYGTPERIRTSDLLLRRDTLPCESTGCVVVRGKKQHAREEVMASYEKGYERG